MSNQGEQVPVAEKVAQQTGLPRPVILVLAHLDPLALGVALGSVAGLWLFVATMILVVRGGEPVGPNLSLLSQYLLGYRVTAGGSLVGFLYGALVGFIVGYIFAWSRNLLVHSYLRYIRRRAEQEVLADILDRLT